LVRVLYVTCLAPIFQSQTQTTTQKRIKQKGEYRKTSNRARSVTTSSQTEKADKPFVVSATFVFVLALLAVAWDFVYLQGMVYRINITAVTGLVLFVIGIVIRAVGKRTLGKYYSYGLRIIPNHKLVTRGIYKHVRHPITLAAMMYDAGIPLIFSSVYGFLLMLGLVPLFLYRIRIEEKMLVKRFGDEYCEYMKRTKRLIPIIY